MHRSVAHASCDNPLTIKEELGDVKGRRLTGTYMLTCMPETQLSILVCTHTRH